MAIARAIEDLPVLVERVVRRTDGKLNAGRGEQGRAVPRGSAAASPSPAWETADEAMRWLLRVEERLAAHVGLRPMIVEAGFGTRDVGNVRGRRRLTAVAGFVTARISALLAWDTREPDDLDGQAEAEVIGRQALSWSARLDRAAGTDRLVHRLVAPCPRLECGARALTRDDGREEVVCRVCGSTWSWAHYPLLVRMITEELLA